MFRFSSEGHVFFGKWILFPANVNVERGLLVPNRFVTEMISYIQYLKINYNYFP